MAMVAMGALLFGLGALFGALLAVRLGRVGLPRPLPRPGDTSRARNGLSAESKI